MLGVNVAQPVNNLLEYFLCEWLLKSATFSDVVEQVTTSAQLHHDYDVFLGFDSFVIFDHSVMPQFQKQVHFFE